MSETLWQWFRRIGESVGKYNRIVTEYKRAVDHAPDHVMAYVNWGVDLAEAGQLEAALEKFEAATQMTPNRWEPWTNWGVALARLNRLDEAQQKFEHALAIDPESANNYVLWGAALIQQGRLEEAIEKYEACLKLNPQNPEPYVNWGIALSRVGHYDQAIQHFKKALSINPFQPQVYFLWGVLLAERERFAEAIDQFKKTLRFIPKHVDALYFWSVSLNRMGNYAEALDKSKRAIRLVEQLGDPKLVNPEMYLNQGDILANLGRLELATANFRHALNLNPRLAAACLSWGVANGRRGLFAEAYRQLDQALEIQADLPGVARWYGQFLVEEGRFEDALPWLERALQEKPEDADALLNKAMVLIKVGQVSEALMLMNQLNERDRWHPQVQYLLGTYYMGLQMFDRAQQHLKRAVDDQPEFLDAVINLALVEATLGNTQDAVRLGRSVLRKNPESPAVNFMYGTILERHGDWKDALNKYEKAIRLDGDFMEPRLGQAEIYLLRGQWETAKRALANMLTHDADYLAARFLMGMTHLREGNALPRDSAGQQACYREATAQLELVLERDPAHLDAQGNLIFLTACLTLGHTPAARDAVDAAFEKQEKLWTDDVSPSRRAMWLLHWGTALATLGFAEAAESRRAEARQLDAGLVARMEKSFAV
ncbi:MAG: tetratricopeptide repeat protein [Candidatus Melainabacteria bacterium]